MRIIKTASYIEATKKKGKKKKGRKYPEYSPNPWAVCTKSVGRDDKEKYEDCVHDVKEKAEVVKPATKKSETIELTIKEAKKKKKDKKWEQEAVSNEGKGTFTAYCKRKGYKGVTDECIAEGKASTDPTTKRRANLAKTFRQQAKNK
jgi:hypothetical protein